ncbi:MAG TPA: hypothetical protein VFO84_02575 [Dehalococcoidia bacterium]|nr:hypothetical protein [Dehalococcoidia bacterium]
MEVAGRKVWRQVADLDPNLLNSFSPVVVKRADLELALVALAGNNLLLARSQDVG